MYDSSHSPELSCQVPGTSSSPTQHGVPRYKGFWIRKSKKGMTGDQRANVLSKTVLESCPLRSNTEQVGLAHRQHHFRNGRKGWAEKSFCYSRFRTSQTRKGGRMACGGTWGTKSMEQTKLGCHLHTQGHVWAESTPALFPSALYVPQNKVCP